MKFFVLGTILALTGCSLNTNYFSDYTGNNLLSSYEFNNVGWATDTTGLDNTASNDLYMTWATTGSAGPGGGAAYKLEINNLIPNGNFVTASSLPNSYWAVYSGDTVSTTTDSNFSSSSSSGTTSVLHYVGSAASHSYLGLDLAASIKATTALTTPGAHQYQFQAEFVDTGSLPFYMTGVSDLAGTTSILTMAQLAFGTQLNSSSTLYSLANQSGVATSISLNFTGSSDTAYLYFGYYDASHDPQSVENFDLSNVRLVPDDVDLYTKLSLPSLSSTSKQLIPGIYQLTLYVKDDSTAGTASNHFYAKGVTVRVTAATKNNLSKQVVVTSTRTSAWSSWTKLTFSLGTLDFVDSNSGLTSGSTTYPALVIEISPTIMNSGTRDSGVVDISDPTLTFVNS